MAPPPSNTPATSLVIPSFRHQSSLVVPSVSGLTSGYAGGSIAPSWIMSPYMSTVDHLSTQRPSRMVKIVVIGNTASLPVAATP